jgi:hypothetical protein
VSDLASRYLEKSDQGAFQAAALLARDLMRDDGEFKQGYTFANAVIAAAEVFHLTTNGTAVAAGHLHDMLSWEAGVR